MDLLLLLGVLPLSMLISRLPISFDGLGVFEAVFMGLLLLAGIDAESSLAIAISGRIVHLAAFLPLVVRLRCVYGRRPSARDVLERAADQLRHLRRAAAGTHRVCGSRLECPAGLH